MAQKKILIIDDEALMRHLLKKILEKEGYATVLAENGQQGLDILKGEFVDLIILDIMMPVMDGFAFFKELKMSPITSEIPVLVLTVRNKMEDSFMALGANAFFGKPLHSEKLLSEIKMIFMENDLDSGELSQEQEESLSATQMNSPKEILEPNNFKTTIQSGEEKKVDETKLQMENHKNVLIAGVFEEVVNYMANILKIKGCVVQKAMTAEEVLAKAIQWKLDIILLQIDMGTISAQEIINAIKQNTVVHTQILLYSYYATKEREQNSIVHTLYAHEFDHSTHNENQPVFYFGAFHKKSFVHRMKKFLPHSH